VIKKPRWYGVVFFRRLKSFQECCTSAWLSKGPDQDRILKTGSLGTDTNRQIFFLLTENLSTRDANLFMETMPDNWINP
jgi:hypothetical protein